MKELTNNELNKILENHKHFLNRDVHNWQSMRVNLIGAYLTRAYLSGAYLTEAENIPYIPMICPEEEGDFIAYKRVRSNIILKLLIPKEAKRCSGLSRKCRCNKAIVLEMQNYKGESIDVKEAYSMFDRSFKYRIGETVEVSDFDENRWNECSTGIHFFINRQEAINYC